MSNKLVIFIDGMSYDFAIKNLTCLENYDVHSVKPGFGFSNNIYPEMICGLNPDNIGYFNEWSPKPKPGKPLNLLLRALDFFRRYTYVNAGIRKLVLRKLLNFDSANIPFRYLHFFSPQGSHNFRDLSVENNFLHAENFKIIDAAEVKKGLGQKDISAIHECHNISSGNLFLSLVDFDNLCHVHGINSHQVAEHVLFLDKSIISISNSFSNLEECQIVIMSDHGMANVSQVINFDIETEFGPMDESQYLYFIDSTFLRVWIRNQSLRIKFKKYLSSQKFGRLITDSERAHYGVANNSFADFMFRANEGVMFVPNFYGGRANKAMHGYDSELNSQRAFFSYKTTSSKKKMYTPPASSVEVYRSLNEIFSN
jgi:hypothetical protein